MYLCLEYHVSKPFYLPSLYLEIMPLIVLRQTFSDLLRWCYLDLFREVVHCFDGLILHFLSHQKFAFYMVRVSFLESSTIYSYTAFYLVQLCKIYSLWLDSIMDLQRTYHLVGLYNSCFHFISLFLCLLDFTVSLPFGSMIQM